VWMGCCRLGAALTARETANAPVKCNGTGQVLPDAELVSRRFGVQMRQLVKRSMY